MKNSKTPETYLSWISEELENANYHDFVELPEKLFNALGDSTILGIDLEKEKLELARIIAEEFYNNI